MSFMLEALARAVGDLDHLGRIDSQTRSLKAMSTATWPCGRTMRC
jgi:hypothetical protein